ncbi:MAG: SPOR domain-containing protein, partial [Treponema sp.]|nr:SPOR domain-containing protein [Treponema sp.]
MKKRTVTAFVIAALLLFQSASVWEGAAAVAPNGELPEGGYYAATNSFPRNTVVDITNLETGKTIRVIVAVGLDSPGLLAVVSRDAAEAIGLQSRSIGRIRMIQPSDPIAFSRFIEGLGSSGDPDYDPRARIAETLGGSSAARTGEGFVDLPETPQRTTAENPWDPWAVSPGIVQEQGDGAADLPETAPLPLVYYPEAYIPPAAVSETLPEPNAAEQPYIPPDVEAAPRYWPETVPGPVPPVAAVPEGAPSWDVGAYDLTLVPAEERPPETAASIIPEDQIVAGIPPAGEELRPVIEPFIDLRYVIDPVPGPAAVPALAVPPAETVPGPVYSIFSVPVISRLEQGKYYVQLGAFSRAEAVES